MDFLPYDGYSTFHVLRGDFMFDNMPSLFSSFFDSVSNLINTLLSFLPRSPFKPFLVTFQELLDEIGAENYIGYLNFFYPIHDIVSITISYVETLALFYAIMVLLRWLKVIE